MLLIGTVAVVDTVTLSAALRAFIYLIPLVLLVITSKPRHLPFLKAALTAYAAVSLVTLLGGTRSLGSLLSIVPAALLAVHAFRAGPHPRDPQRFLS